jgi:predicted transcriptional regulator
MKNVSFRIDENKLNKFDAIVKREKLDRSAVLNELIDYKIDLGEWQLAQIEEGLAQLDRGEHSKDGEIIKLLLK